MNKRGFALIALIILILVIGLLVYPTSMFIRQSLKLNAVRAQKFQAYAASHAGLMRAAYEILQNNTYTSLEAQLNGNQWYKYAFNTSSSGGNAGAGNIYIDASSSSNPVNTTITDWTLVNTSTEAGAITSIQFSWIPASNNLTSVTINGVNVWSGTAVSGTVVDITDVTIPASTTLTSNTLVFSGKMSNVTVYATLFFANGTGITRRIRNKQNPPILPDGGPWYPTGLKSWWKMYAGSGSTVDDIINPNFSGNATDGSLGSHANWTSSGKFGPAIDFDANNNAEVTVGNNSALTNGSFSISCWVYLNGLPGANKSYGIICRGNNSSSAPYDLTRGYEIYVNRNNDPTVANRNKIIFAIGPNGTSNKAISTSVPATSTWIHVAGTYDSPNAKLYVASVLNDTVSSSYTANGSFYMGVRNNRNNTNLDGIIDEVTFFNRALTSAEVAALYAPNNPSVVIPTVIKSTGKFIDNSATVQMRQTMIGTFSATSGAMKVTNYSETVEHLLP